MPGFSRKMTTILFLVLVLAVLVPYTLPLRNGRPLLSLPDLYWPTLPTTRLPFGLGAPQQETAPTMVTFYRWRDAAGVWQYDTAPPPAGVVYETRTVDPQANLLPAIAPAAPAADNNPVSQDGNVSSAASTPTAPSYAPERVKQLFDDARGLGEQSQERQTVLEKL